MNKTWASGAIELLTHASGHIRLDTAFDKRIAFISIDNAVEITIRTYLSLPKQFFGDERPSRKEIEECNNGFTNYLSLLVKYANKKLVGIEAADIEHYHRIRNTLYHDGTGLAVDHEYLNAYFALAKLLLKHLFGVDLKETHEEVSLEKLIFNWNLIEELLVKILGADWISAGPHKWQGAIEGGLLTDEDVKDIKDLRLGRNKIVHSKSIDSSELRMTFNKSVSVLDKLKKRIDVNIDIIKARNFFFEPNVSNVTGKLTVESFYGPPNYGLSPETDAVEKAWILNLDKPINVFQDKQELEEGDHNSTRFNIDRIQLANGAYNFDLSKGINKRITIKGTFFGQHTGHHVTPVLLNVLSVMFYAE